jgi:hypothetical protein
MTGLCTAIPARDLGSLPLERCDPIRDRSARVALGEPGYLEEIVQLRITELIEESREVVSPGLTNGRVAQTATP